MTDIEAPLVSLELYETNAVNIGTQQKSADMKRFISKIRDDGLYLLDLETTDGRIRTIATFINMYNPETCLIPSVSGIVCSAGRIESG